MIRTLLILIQIALVVAVAVWLADRPGHVTIDWQGWRIDTTFWLLLLAVLFLIIVAALAYRIWRFLLRFPRQLVQAKKSNRQRKGYEALTRGMVALAAGDADGAMRLSRRANILLDDAPLSMLLKAEATQLEGDDAGAKRYFNAMRSNPETAFLAVRGLLMQAVAVNDTKEALRLAKEANILKPGAKWVLEQLFKLQVSERDWQAADNTIQEALRHKTIDKFVAKRCRAVIYVERARQVLKRGKGGGALDLARIAHELDPKLIPAAIIYAEQLSLAGNNRKAVKVLEDIWKRQPNSEIAKNYRALFSTDDALSSVKRMNRLHEVAPDSMESRIEVGSSALVAQLWGEARKYLTIAAEERPTARVCRLMADLEESTNAGSENVKRWLVRATIADADAGWVCSGCGAVAEDWSAICANCRDFDALEWSDPPKAPKTDDVKKSSSIKNDVQITDS